MAEDMQSSSVPEPRGPSRTCVACPASMSVPEHITLFPFPWHLISECTRWTRSVRKLGGLSPHWSPKRPSFVCQLHFPSYELVENEDGTLTLKGGACPKHPTPPTTPTGQSSRGSPPAVSGLRGSSRAVPSPRGSSRAVPSPRGSSRAVPSPRGLSRAVRRTRSMPAMPRPGKSSISPAPSRSSSGRLILEAVNQRLRDIKQMAASPPSSAGDTQEERYFATVEQLDNHTLAIDYVIMLQKHLTTYILSKRLQMCGKVKEALDGARSLKASMDKLKLPKCDFYNMVAFEFIPECLQELKYVRASKRVSWR